MDWASMQMDDADGSGTLFGVKVTLTAGQSGKEEQSGKTVTSFMELGSMPAGNHGGWNGPVDGGANDLPATSCYAGSPAPAVAKAAGELKSGEAEGGTSGAPEALHHGGDSDSGEAGGGHDAFMAPRGADLPQPPPALDGLTHDPTSSCFGTAPEVATPAANSSAATAPEGGSRRPLWFDNLEPWFET